MINVTFGGGATLKFLEEVNSNLDDLIEWGVIFVNCEESYYPLSMFKREIEETFDGVGLDEEVAATVRRVEERIQPFTGG